MPANRIETFAEFYPYYLGEHANQICRILHFVGTTLFLGTLAAAALQANPGLLLWLPLAGYGPAWIGHFFFEHNKPATFNYPLWSLRADYHMYGRMLRGQLWHNDSLKQVAHEARQAIV